MIVLTDATMSVKVTDMCNYNGQGQKADDW